MHYEFLTFFKSFEYSFAFDRGVLADEQRDPNRKGKEDPWRNEDHGNEKQLILFVLDNLVYDNLHLDFNHSVDYPEALDL